MNQIDTINVLGISFLLLGQGYDSPKTKIKLNILFIWTDGQAAGTMEVYGNKIIKTSHLNKLSNVVFSQKGFKPDQQEVNKFSREFVSILI